MEDELKNYRAEPAPFVVRLMDGLCFVLAALGGAFAVACVLALVKVM